MVSTHQIDTIKFIENSLILQVDGKEYSFDLKKISMKLLSANELQRNLYNTSPSGYGIHWPLIDEDLSIDSLLKNA
jgi:hypothetical protein